MHTRAHVLASHVLAPLAISLALAVPAPAQTNVVLVFADADATLYEDATGSLANGAGPSLFVGTDGTGLKRRALLRFDVAAALPAGATILSSRLELSASPSTATQPLQVSAHRVAQPWNEGPGTAPGSGASGGPAAPGDTTWLHRDYPAVSWSTPGGDFAPAASFVFELPSAGALLTDPFPGLVADLQDMLDNPTSNRGWLLKTDELQAGTARRIDSREGSPTPPKLLIAWVAAGTTATFGRGTPTPAGNCAVAIQGPATGGTTVTATYTFLPSSSIGANFFSLALDPIGTALSPDTRAYLPPNGFVPGALITTDAGGSAAASIAIPAGFPPTLIAMQTAVIDQSQLGFALTNAAVMLTQ